MKRCEYLWTAGLILIAALVSWGEEPPAPTLKNDVQPIFNKECSRCHGVKTARAKLNLSPATAFKALVNTPSSEVPELMRVKPGDPESSYLWQKLQHRADKGKGMPRGMFWSKRLPDSELEIVKKWIEAGATE